MKIIPLAKGWYENYSFYVNCGSLSPSAVTERAEWLKNHAQGDWRRPSMITRECRIWFELESDVSMFLLRWS